MDGGRALTPGAIAPAATEDDHWHSLGVHVYDQQVGPCNARAEVVFSHKTGLLYNAGADAGFVHELPGERRRDHVIAVFTNLGNRFTDPVMNTASTDPAGPFGCWTERDVCYAEAFARLGAEIDRRLQRGGR